MIRSYSPLKVERIGARKWRLLEDFVTPFGIVPKGFVTDGVTIPRIFWSIASPAGEAFEAAVVHDWMLRDPKFTANEAHCAFWDALRDFGVGRYKATVMYLAVKTYGALVYGNDSRAIH